MKTIRFLFFLCIVFFLAFFFSGGTEVFNANTIANIHQTAASFMDQPSIRKDESDTSKVSHQEDTHEISALDRMSRAIFLRNAVESRVSREHYITVEQMSPELIQAILAIEDNRFYSHHGFDPEAIMRAALVNLQYGQIEEGASTITQQVVKNLFLSHEQSFGRKAEEFVLALDMELHYSKDEILALYLNTIYFGSNYYGVYDASMGYFGKKPKDLALPEAAMLAGLPNAPSLYSPYVDFLMAKKRQFIVLDAMVRTGCISKSIAEDAKIKPIYLDH